MQDSIIIGAGHNALVTAFYLAKAGRKPLVLERRPIVGGSATHPGGGIMGAPGRNAALRMLRETR